MRKGLEKQKKDPNVFYKVIDDIRQKKQGDLLDDDENLKAFNNYMALRFLSMDRGTIDIVNGLNQYQGVLDKKQMYDLLIDLIPPQRGFIRYVSTKKKENEYIDYICDYYQCSPVQAAEYLKIKGEEWAKQLINEYGGKL
jgi:hypothetical protein